MSNADHAHIHINKKRRTAENLIFGLRGPRYVQIHQNVYFENLTQQHFFLYHIWEAENMKNVAVAFIYDFQFPYDCLTIALYLEQMKIL